jgi:tetratricopeptide (TPR) repeat protein
MKRIITLITLAGVSVTALAKEQVVDVDSSPALAFYATHEWQQAFMGYYGVETGTEPGIPEGEQEREVLGQVRTFLQTGTDADVRAAAAAITGLLQQQRTAGTDPSPMMLQIAGTLAMREAEITKNPDRSKQLQERAARHLQAAVDPTKGFPNFLRAHKNLANLLFRMDKPKMAKDHFIKSIQLGDRDAVSFGILGAIYMDEGKLISSETALRNSIMINPGISQFKQLLGNVLLQQERYSEAKEIFAELLIKSPNEANFWMAQANCYIALDEIDKAARNLEIVRFMGESNVPSLMLLGDVYMNKEMVAEATEVYLEAISREPTSANLANFIRSAETLNNFAAYEQGMQVINAVAKAYQGQLDDQEEIDLLSLSSEINISLGKGEEAAKNLEALLRKDPFNARALLSLARYYSDLTPDLSLPDVEYTTLKRRHEQTAILYYERAQRLEDEDDITARVRAYVGEAQLRVKRRELEQAAELLNEAQTIKYQDNIQAYLNQIEEALKHRRSS